MVVLETSDNDHLHYLLLLLPPLTRTTSHSSMGVISCASSICKHGHNNDHLYYLPLWIIHECRAVHGDWIRSHA